MKFHTSVIDAAIYFVQIIAFPKIITALGITIMITNPTIDIAEIVGAKLPKLPINVFSVGVSSVINVDYRRIMDVKEFMFLPNQRPLNRK